MEPGLPNFGATCYCNSILQLLCNAQSGFIADILTYEPRTDLAAKFRAFVAAYTARSGHLLPEFLKSFLTAFFTEYPALYNGQQDQHEFLTALLSVIHKGFYQEATFDISSPAIAGTLPRDELESLVRFRDTALSHDDKKGVTVDSPVVKWFTGQFVTVTTCRDIGCGHVAKQYDSFRTIELPVESTVETAFHCFTLNSSMDDYRCDKCGKTTVDRKTMIWRAPRILALAFKRTVFSRGFPFKDERTVSFQPTLDLSEYFMRPLGVMKYNLVGTGDHVGVANSGHCFSYVATLEGWKLFDDMRVSDITEPICPSSNQYMLFYTKTVN